MARPSPAIAEAMAIYRGLILARDVGLLPCTVESDAQVVVNFVNDTCIPLSELGTFFSDILLFLECHPGCSIVFSSRLSNLAAHGLAKIGLSSGKDSF